jgi:hypothetical protein
VAGLASVLARLTHPATKPRIKWSVRAYTWLATVISGRLVPHCSRGDENHVGSLRLGARVRDPACKATDEHRLAKRSDTLCGGRRLERSHNTWCLFREPHSIVDPFLAIADLAAVVGAIIFYDSLLVLDFAGIARRSNELLDLDGIVRGIDPEFDAHHANNM